MPQAKSVVDYAVWVDNFAKPAVLVVLQALLKPNPREAPFRRYFADLNNMSNLKMNKKHVVMLVLMYMLLMNLLMMYSLMTTTTMMMAWWWWW